MADIKKIYLAAPVFSVSEREINKYIADGLEETGEYEVFLPQMVSPKKIENGYDMFPIFKKCKSKIISSDIIVAIVDGPDVDSGVAWELGYAFANEKKSICVRTDIRKAEAGGVNTMVEYGTTKTLYFTKYRQDIRDIINKIIFELKEISAQ